MNSKSIALSIALILAFVDFGSCELQCYHCNSLLDTVCTSTAIIPIPGINNIVSCDTLTSKVTQGTLLQLLPSDVFKNVPTPDTSYCYKIVFVSGIIIRTCLAGLKSDKNAICDIILKLSVPGFGGLVKSCEACDYNKCNE